MPIRKLDKTRTVCIAGAGPSGLAAAIYLKRQGFDVEVHEARDCVGARWKRGFQILENFSVKEDVLDFCRSIGIKINFETIPVHNVTLCGGRGKRVEFNSPSPLGYCLRRGSQEGDFDRGLLDQAAAAGVKIVFDSRKHAEETDIFAAGPRRVDGIGRELTFKTNLSDRMVVVLDPILAPGGYAYLFIIKGEATLGMAVVYDLELVKKNFDIVVKRFVESEGIDPAGGEAASFHVNFFIRDSLHQQGSLFVGEAGGFQDYLFGFGMRLALESGSLAARSLIEGEAYDRLWKKHLKKKQLISLWNRFFYERLKTWLPDYFIRGASKAVDFRSYMGTWYRPGPVHIFSSSLIRKLWRNRDLTHRVKVKSAGRAEEERS